MVFSIVDGNDDGKFALESSHNPALIIKKSLDYDAGDHEFKLKIMASVSQLRIFKHCCCYLFKNYERAIHNDCNLGRLLRTCIYARLWYDSSMVAINTHKIIQHATQWFCSLVLCSLVTSGGANFTFTFLSHGFLKVQTIGKCTALSLSTIDYDPLYYPWLTSYKRDNAK